MTPDELQAKIKRQIQATIFFILVWGATAFPVIFWITPKVETFGRGLFPGNNLLFMTLIFFPYMLALFLPLFFFIHLIERRYRLNCPQCHRSLISNGRYTLRTGRCRRCYTVVTTPLSPEFRPKEIKQSNRAMVRMIVYIAVIALVFPFLVNWLDVHGKLPPNQNNVWHFTLGFWGILILLILLPLIFGMVSEHLKKKRLAEDALIASPYPFLTILRPRRMTTQCFKLYFAPSMLCFAHVAGSHYSEDNPVTKSQGGFILIPFIQWGLRNKRRREALYDSLNPASPDLLVLDPVNFQIPRDQVRTLSFMSTLLLSWRQRRSSRAPYSPGLLTIETIHQTFICSIISELSKPEINAICDAWSRADH